MGEVVAFFILGLEHWQPWGFGSELGKSGLEAEFRAQGSELGFRLAGFWVCGLGSLGSGVWGAKLWASGFMVLALVQLIAPAMPTTTYTAIPQSSTSDILIPASQYNKSPLWCAGCLRLRVTLRRGFRP